jgi:hypothetical protein
MDRSFHTKNFRFPYVAFILSVAFLVTDNRECLGQVTQTHRFESQNKGSDDDYTVISLHDKGVALLRTRNKYSGSKRQWEITVLDTALQEQKIIQFHLEERYPLIGFEVTPTNLYLLYRAGENVKNNLLLLEFNILDGTETLRHEIKPELDFKITHFSKIGSSFVLGGYVSNDPTILLYNMMDKNIKAVPGFFIKDNELIDLRVNQNGTFNVVLVDRSQKTERKLVFKTFDETGKLLLDDIVPIDNERYLQTSLSSTLQREDMMVLGTWGEKQSKQASGFYALPVDPFSDQKIKYFHLGEMQHFVDYLNPKRAERIKTNTKEDLDAGKKPSFVSYVVPFQVIEDNDGYLLLAEVYNPVTISTPYSNSPYGNPYFTNPYNYYNPFSIGYYPGMRYRPGPMQSFNPNTKTDEIKTFESVLLAFDPQGNLRWDHSMKLENISRPSLDQVSDFYYTGSEVVFLYKNDSDIKIKTVVLGKDGTIEGSQKIKLKEPADEIRHEKEGEGGLKHWVQNSFYVWGYQTIRNPDLKENRVRDVFYINKLVVH